MSSLVPQGAPLQDPQHPLRQVREAVLALPRAPVKPPPEPVKPSPEPAPLSALPPEAEPAPAGEEPTPRPLGGDGRPHFLGQLDDDILERICRLPVRSFRQLGGGASVTMRAVLSDGSQVAVKPEQAHVTRYQSEVAAYRVARALRLQAVAPSCVRSFPREEMVKDLPPSLVTRIDAEVPVRRQGQVAAAVISWIPDLHGLHLERADWWRPLLRRGTPIPASRRRRLMEISTLLLFDYLILNDDRWSGGNTHEVPGQMVYLDQGAAFGSDQHGQRERKLQALLRTCQRFDHDVVEALQRLDLRAISADLAPLLTGEEVTAFRGRVEQARRYLLALHTEAPVDSWY